MITAAPLKNKKLLWAAVLYTGHPRWGFGERCRGWLPPFASSGCLREKAIPTFPSRPWCSTVFNAKAQCHKAANPGRHDERLSPQTRVAGDLCIAPEPSDSPYCFSGARRTGDSISRWGILHPNLATVGPGARRAREKQTNNCCRWRFYTQVTPDGGLVGLPDYCGVGRFYTQATAGFGERCFT